MFTYYNVIFLVPGYLLFKEFCEQTSEEPVPQLKFYEEVNYIFHVHHCRTIKLGCIFKRCFSQQIKLYEKQECVEERRRIARDIYDNFIMKELLAHSHVSIRKL